MRVVAVGSGKGGVGKSTVALNMALALSEMGRATGILDADVYGPNIPLMLNLARQRPAKSWTLARAGGHSIEPIEVHGIKVMSSGFIVAEDQPLNWDASLIRFLVRQLLHEVTWGELDVLVVDLPPGTGDVQAALVSELRPHGVVLVVTPQDVAHLDARKSLAALEAAGVRVLGAVENMTPLGCPHCGGRVEVFHPVREDRAIWAHGVEQLGAVPLDPEIGRPGMPLLVSRPQSPQAWALRQVADRVAALLA